MTYCFIPILMHLSIYIREVSVCSRWWLAQIPTTGQGERNKKLQNGHLYMGQLNHISPSRGK